jgi:hypothetical protein
MSSGDTKRLINRFSDYVDDRVQGCAERMIQDRRALALGLKLEKMTACRMIEIPQGSGSNLPRDLTIVTAGAENEMSAKAIENGHYN